VGETEQRIYDDIVSNTIADYALTKLRKNKTLLDKLKDI
jgi:hypothetical protein